MSYKFIAEVKTKSPFGWRSDRSWDELFELAAAYGDMVSVHTEAPWGGSYELLSKARALTDKPLLAKGIHADDQSISAALDRGADAVLVVGRIPLVPLEKCLLEPLRLTDFRDLPGDQRVVWNSRDLRDGNLKEETFEAARSLWRGWLCQASNIKTPEDVSPQAQAILVGQYLPEFINHKFGNSI